MVTFLDKLVSQWVELMSLENSMQAWGVMERWPLPCCLSVSLNRDSQGRGRGPVGAAGGGE